MWNCIREKRKQYNLKQAAKHDFKYSSILHFKYIFNLGKDIHIFFVNIHMLPEGIRR